MEDRKLNISIFQDEKGNLTNFGNMIIAYFSARKEMLETHVAPNLMVVDEARQHFELLHDELNPTCPLPLNKQSGKKRTTHFLVEL